jgi:cardiolipin synthase A/B
MNNQRGRIKRVDGMANSIEKLFVQFFPKLHLAASNVRKTIRLSDGTRLQLYVNGQGLRAAYEAIKEAKRRVCLEIYTFQSDETGMAFAKLLAEKARSGVRVYVLYDFVGSSSSDLSMFEEMEKAGVRLASFHPVQMNGFRFRWRITKRDHRKLLLIDHNLAGLGGLNVASEYAGSWIVRSKRYPTSWRDCAIGLRGLKARALLRVFARAWRYAHRGGDLKKLELLQNSEGNEFSILAAAPTYNHAFTDRLKKMIRQARFSILITMAYFAPNDEILNELCAAVRRGVKVRLMLPGECDVKFLLFAARSLYEKLLSAGVEIYERQRIILHSKVICIDSLFTMIGSTNLDFRSCEHNCELSVLIRSAPLAAQIHEMFSKDVGRAQRISLEKCRDRHLSEKLVCWVARRMRSLL